MAVEQVLIMPLFHSVLLPAYESYPLLRYEGRCRRGCNGQRGSAP